MTSLERLYARWVAVDISHLCSVKLTLLECKIAPLGLEDNFSLFACNLCWAVLVMFHIMQYYLVPVPHGLQTIQLCWKVTSQFGLCAACAFSAGNIWRAGNKHHHRTSPPLPFLSSSHLSCSRLQIKTSPKNITDEKFKVISLSSFRSLFPFFDDDSSFR